MLDLREAEPPQSYQHEVNPRGRAGVGQTEPLVFHEHHQVDDEQQHAADIAVHKALGADVIVAIGRGDDGQVVVAPREVELGPALLQPTGVVAAVAHVLVARVTQVLDGFLGLGHQLIAPGQQFAPVILQLLRVHVLLVRAGLVPLRQFHCHAYLTPHIAKAAGF